MFQKTGRVCVTVVSVKTKIAPGGTPSPVAEWVCEPHCNEPSAEVLTCQVSFIPKESQALYASPFCRLGWEPDQSLSGSDAKKKSSKTLT